MIRFCTYILLAALTMQSFYRSIMTVEYQIHLPEYVLACINKDKPQLHCDGQCVLMKKIAEKEKEETQKNLIVYEYSTHYVHKERDVFVMNPTYREIEPKPFSPYLIQYSFAYEAPVFRPPIV